MENNKPGLENRYIGEKKKQPIGLIIILIILLIIALVLAYIYFDLKRTTVPQEDYTALKFSKDSLNDELSTLYADFDSLKTNNDSMNILIAAQQEKIMKIIKDNNYNRYRISQYKKELGTLREIMRSFVVQIDSLNTLNQQLTAQNIEISSKLKQTESEKEKLQEKTEILNSKVELASRLSAKEIVAVGLNKNSKERDRSKTIEKVRTCFTLRENNIVPAGPKSIFLRIIRPDGFLMVDNTENTFESEDGQLIYSAKREVEYENQDVPMCIYYEKTEEFTEGTYKVELYADGHLIGESSFTFK